MHDVPIVRHGGVAWGGCREKAEFRRLAVKSGGMPKVRVAFNCLIRAGIPRQLPLKMLS